MNEEQQQKFEAWGLLELFGHQRLAGRLTEQTIGGCSFIRIDVPAVDGVQEYTRLFGQGAIYGITITTEDVARRLAAGMRARPISPYDLPRTPALPSRGSPDDGEY
jgi:hypothetical protein